MRQARQSEAVDQRRPQKGEADRRRRKLARRADLRPRHGGEPRHDDDGHRLFFGDGGSRLWGPVMETYLRQHKVPIGSAGDAHPAPG